MATQTTLTLEQFFALPEREPDGTHYELSEGELISLSPAGYRHSVIVINIGHILRSCLNRSEFIIAGGEAGFILNPTPEAATVRGADVAVNRRDSLPGNMPIGFFPGSPLVAVEVVSPSNTAEDLELKIQQYLAAGSSEVWVVYPETHNVYLFSTDRRNPRVFEEGEQFESVLGAFQVSEFFQI